MILISYFSSSFDVTIYRLLNEFIKTYVYFRLNAATVKSVSAEKGEPLKCPAPTRINYSR